MRARLTEHDFVILAASLQMYRELMKSQFQATREQVFREELVVSSYLDTYIQKILVETPEDPPSFTEEHISVFIGALEAYQVALVVLMRNEPKVPQEELKAIREIVIKLLSIFSQTGVASKNLLELYAD